MRICSKCAAEKPETEFHKDKSKASGFCSQCKICRCEKEKQFRLNNPEKAKVLDKDKYRRNKEYNASYYRKNAEKRREYYKIYYQEKLDKIKANAKRYWGNNKEEIIKRRKYLHE